MIRELLSRFLRFLRVVAVTTWLLALLLANIGEPRARWFALTGSDLKEDFLNLGGDFSTFT